MNIFDVGAWELGFIVLLAIIFIGPKRMAETGTTVGRWLNKFVKSDAWIAMKEVWNALAHAPTQMMREANLEDLQKELNLDSINPFGAAEPHPNASHRAKSMAAPSVDNSILPPDRSQTFVGTPPEPPSADLSIQKPTQKAREAAKKKSPKVKSSSVRQSKAKSAPKKSTTKKRSNA